MPFIHGHLSAFTIVASLLGLHLFAAPHVAAFRVNQGAVAAAQREKHGIASHELNGNVPAAMLPSTPVKMFPSVAHPFPSFFTSDIKLAPTLICSVSLFLAGVLCSAGGLGGGGIYVTLLMVAGQLSVHDAVPLSKAIVFLGSLSSLVLNLKRTTLHPLESGKSLIDFNVCRLVVPSALLGTLVGVMMNSYIPGAVIVALLASILIGVTYMSARTCAEQWYQETSTHPMPPLQPTALVPPRHCWGTKEESPATMQGALLRGEGLGAFSLLSLIVAFGVLRAHVSKCQLNPEACRSSVISAFLGEAFLPGLMHRSTSSEVFLMLCLFLPLCICSAVVLGYGAALVKHEGYSKGQVATYCGMAVLTGCFAGLVGIGGGLIFAPVFLFMGREPSTAVATSATCVIFTSSSTTFQYLLTDRVSLSLSLVYGLVTMVASFVGTSLVHFLQDKWNTKRSYISGIVCLGVLISVFLSLWKLLTLGIAPAHQ